VADGTAAAPLPRGLVLAYGTGAVATAIFGTVPSLLLLYFMTDTLGIAPGLAGATLAAGKLWDVVVDPLVGALSDRTRGGWGRRRPWILAGGLTMPIAFALLFSVPDLATVHARWLWVLLCYVAASTAFATYQVPYVAMPAEMSDDAGEQTLLMAWRMSAMVVGILLAGALAPQLVRLGGNGRAGYALMGRTLAVVCALAMLTAFAGTHRAPTLARGRTAPLATQVAAVLRNAPFRLLVLAIVVQLVAMSTLVAVVPYVATYLLGGGATTVTLLFVCLVAPALVAMPAWVAAGRRLGRIGAWIVATAVFAALNLGLVVAGPGRFAAVAATVALMGLAYGGTQVFPYALLPDAITAGSTRSGIEQGGVLAGLLTASEKSGNALGALVAGTVLQVTGFVEAAGGATPTQPASALWGIRVCAGVLPPLLLFASLPLLRRWRTTPPLGR
jgi:GPH family glycoside/pentoside/hexuronide:cation symporter